MRESYGIRIATDPPTRFWNGVGDLTIPADAVEAGSATYLGAGELVNVPDFQALINGVAERLTLVVSGVAAASLALAREEAAQVKGAEVQFARFEFADDWSLVSVEYEATFRADTLTTGNQPNENGRSRSISLSIGTEDTSRSRAPIAFWTDPDQRRRSSTDAICDHVAGISAGTSRRFGPT